MELKYFPLGDAYKVTSNFSYSRKNPVTHKVVPHKGVDIAPTSGVIHQNIYATNSGTAKVGYSTTQGNYIEIYDGEDFSCYYHLNDTAVTTGEEVRAGEVIGHMGSTGQSTGEHLHYGINLNGVYVNPWDYIKTLPSPVTGSTDASVETDTTTKSTEKSSTVSSYTKDIFLFWLIAHLVLVGIYALLKTFNVKMPTLKEAM